MLLKPEGSWLMWTEVSNPVLAICLVQKVLSILVWIEPLWLARSAQLQLDGKSLSPIGWNRILGTSLEGLAQMAETQCKVSQCTVWLLHSKWLSEQSNKSTSYFASSLNISPWILFRWFRRLQPWETGDWPLYHDNTPAHASHLMQIFLWNIRSPRWLSPPTAQS